MHILYVDDEPDLLEIGKLFLEQGGEFGVDTAISAPAALEMMNNKTYDAIISDYMMPEMDGIGFLKIVRASGSTVPFIIFTGRGREDVVIDALNNGADFYLQKGGEPKILFMELKHVVRQSVLMRKAQTSLAEQQQRYHDIQNANDLIQSVAPDGQFVFVNKKWLDTLGYREDELPGLRIFDIIHEESLAHCMETFQRVLRGENTGIFDAVFKTRNGKKVYVEGMASCRITDGKPQYTRGIFKDVTDRKIAEAALKESEERYRHVVEDQSEFISRFKPDGTHVFVNDAYCRYFGLKRDEIIGNRFMPVIHPDDAGRVKLFFESLTPDHPVDIIEQRIIMPDGSTCWQRWSHRAIFDEHGSLIEYQSVGRDFTEKKEAENELLRKNEELNAAYEKVTATEEELRQNYDELSIKQQALLESEERFRTLFQNAADAHLLLVNGIHTDCNQALLTLMRCTRKEVIGHSLIELSPEFQPDGSLSEEKAAVFIREAFETGSKRFEWMHRRPDGTDFWAEIVATSLIIDGKPTLFGSWRDITERKKMEDALRESEERYRNVVEDQTELISRFTPDGTHVFVNEAYCRYFGQKREDILGHRFRPVIPEEDKERVQKFFASLTMEHPVDIIEHRIVMPDGSIRWQRWSDRVIFDDSGSLIEYQSVGRDTTDKMAAEKALRESEEKFRAMVEQSTEGITIIDFSGNLLFANNRAWDIIDYKPGIDKPAAINVIDFVVPELQKVAVDDILRYLSGIDSYSAIYEIITYAKKRKWVECAGKKISYKGSSALLLSFRDITYRKRIEEELRSSEERYRVLFHDNPTMLFTLDPEGNVLAVNESGARQLGYTADELEGQSVLKVFYPDDHRAVAEQLQTCLRSPGEVFRWQFRKVRKDKSVLWVEEFARVMVNPGGETNVLVVCQDITDRKRTEEALRESEEKYRTIIENMQDVYYRTDADGNLLFVSPSAAPMLGYESASEFLGKNIAETIYYDPKERVKFLAELDKTGSVSNYEIKLKKPDGSAVLISANSHKYYDASGKYLGVEGIFRDITSESRAKDALQKSEEKYRTVFENTGMATVLVEEDTLISLANAEFVRLSGYSKDEIEQKKSWTEFVVKEDLERMLAQHRLRRENRESALRHYEFRFVTKAGIIRDIFLTIDVIPGTKKSIASLLDITERKQAERDLFLKNTELNAAYEQLMATEEELRANYEELLDSGRRLDQSEQKFRALIDNANGAVLVIQNGRICFANYKAEEISGYSKEELAAAPSFLEFIHPDDRAMVGREHMRRLSGEKLGQSYTFRIFSKKGSVLWMEIKASLIQWDGQPGVLVILSDITERRHAEDELMRFRISVEQAADEVFWLDFDGNILYVNDAACTMTGYSRDELLSMKVHDLDPGMTPGMREDVTSELRTKGTRLFTTRHRRKDGTFMDVEIMSVYVNRDNREYSFAFVRDIAQRKQNELALRESDKRYRLILQNANDAIFIHEISHGGPGRFIEVNDHACRMLGYTRDELLQMGVPDIDVPEIKEKVPGIIEKLFSSGNAVFQTFHLTKDRRRIPVEVSNRLIGLDGRPAVLSIVRDLSDLKRTEEAAQAANRKLRLLNSITRHDIQNKVTILTGYLSLAREKSTNPMMVSYIEKLESAVKSISDHVEFTKIYQDLGTTEPQWQDLGRAMPRPADIHQVTFDADMDGIMVYADPTLAKVFSNLLDNTLRHGGHAKTIRVSAHESENGLTVVWQDDGVGIPEKEKEKIFLQGYGKNTGLGLFLCREILSITGMTIKETGKPANGARFEIFVPTGIYKIDKRV